MRTIRNRNSLASPILRSRRLINPNKLRSAKGFGKDVKGAFASAAPDTYEVNSLADSGVGTLREAWEATGNRLITFHPNLEGTIATDTAIDVTDGQFTLIGNGKIEVTNNDRTSATVNITGVDDFYVYNIRIRPGRASSGTLDSVDALNLSGCTNGYFRNISTSLSVDELIAQSGDCDNITYENSLIALPIDDGHSSGPHAYGLFLAEDGDTQSSTSILTTAFVSNRFRNPLVFTDAPVEIVGCLFHDCKDILTLKSKSGSDTKVNFVKNRITNTGPESIDNGTLAIVESSISSAGSNRVYLSGNVADSGIATKNESNGAITEEGTPFTTPTDYEPFSVPELTDPQSWGCLPHDALDAAVVARIINNQGGYPDTNDEARYGRYGVYRQTTQELTAPNLVLDVSKTVEIKGRFKTSGAAARILGCYDYISGNRSWGVHINGSGGFVVALSEDGTTVFSVADSSQNWADGNWHYFEVVLASSTVTIYMDQEGARSSASTTTDTGTFPSSLNEVTYPIGIGSYPSNHDAPTISLSDFEIVQNGVTVFEWDGSSTDGLEGFPSDLSYELTPSAANIPQNSLVGLWDFSAQIVDGSTTLSLNDGVGTGHSVKNLSVTQIGTLNALQANVDSTATEASVSNTVTLGDFTVHAVVEQPYDGFSGTRSIFGQDASNRLAYRVSDDGITSIFTRINATNYEHSITDTEDLIVITYRRIGTTLTTFVNGIQEGQSTVSGNTFENTYMFGRGNSGTQTAIGNIGEIQIHNEGLSDTDIARDASYLLGKWSQTQSTIELINLDGDSVVFPIVALDDRQILETAEEAADYVLGKYPDAVASTSTTFTYSGDDIKIATKNIPSIVRNVVIKNQTEMNAALTDLTEGDNLIITADILEADITFSVDNIRITGAPTTFQKNGLTTHAFELTDCENVLLRNVRAYCGAGASNNPDSFRFENVINITMLNCTGALSHDGLLDVNNGDKVYCGHCMWAYPLAGSSSHHGQLIASSPYVMLHKNLFGPGIETRPQASETSVMDIAACLFYDYDSFVVTYGSTNTGTTEGNVYNNISYGGPTDFNTEIRHRVQSNNNLTIRYADNLGINDHTVPGTTVGWTTSELADTGTATINTSPQKKEGIDLAFPGGGGELTLETFADYGTTNHDTVELQVVSDLQNRTGMIILTEVTIGYPLI